MLLPEKKLYSTIITEKKNSTLLRAWQDKKYYILPLEKTKAFQLIGTPIFEVFSAVCDSQKRTKK